MFDNEYLSQLIKLGKTSTESANIQMKVLDETMKDMLRKVDDKEKPEIEKLMATMNKSIALAKQGKSAEAQEIIKQFSDGRKSSKKSV
jgi:CHASE3 domain sensor protein